MSEKASYVWGARPVLEALRGGLRVEAVYLARGDNPGTSAIRAEAARRRVAVHEVGKDELSRRAGGENHQGALAAVDIGALGEADVQDILQHAAGRQEEPLVLVLDQIQDPQNFGALVRSAHALGAHGVVTAKDRAAPVTGAVVRASAGAALLLPIATVVNVKRALEELTAAGVWTAAAVLDGQPAHQARLDGPLAVVVGSEGRGVRKTVAEACDLRVTIPLGGGFDSLNASVAGGILLYEAQRQRWARA